MAQPVPLPSAHSVRVFGGDSFVVNTLYLQNLLEDWNTVTTALSNLSFFSIYTYRGSYCCHSALNTK